MTRNLKAFFLIALAAAAISSSALALDNDKVIERCSTNIALDQLSPQVAEECIKYFHDDPSILETLRADSSDSAGDILAYNSALKDYKKTITSYKNLDLYPHFNRIMTQTACPLCKLGLGPEPELSFPWAEKYLPQDKTAEFMYSVKTWDSLGPVRTPALTAQGRAKGEWNSQSMIDRYRALAAWARQTAAQILAIPAATYPDKGSLARVVPVLQEDVFDENLDLKLKEYLKILGLKPIKTAPSAGAKAATDKAAKASSDAAALKGMSTGAQAEQLDSFFNGTGHHPADELDAKKGAASKYAYKEIPKADIAKLGARLLQQNPDGSISGPLAKEIKGTRAGDEILAFYKDKDFQKAGTNKLAFGFEPMRKGLFGGWNWVNEDVKLNSELVNDWMKKNKVTPEQLMAGDPATNPHLRGLSQYLAPTFVHEATHQRQTAGDKRDGIDLFKYKGKSNSYYQMEKETEAFSMDASFSAEKYSKLPKGAREKYLDKLDPFDKANMKIFQKQGVDGIRLSNHKSYSDKESLDGYASKEFVMAKSTSMRLEALRAKVSSDPASLTNTEMAELQSLSQEMDSKFKWYSITMRESVDAENKINKWRADINQKISGSRPMGKPVPTLLSP